MSEDEGWESETKMRLWKKREELENRKGINNDCQFYEGEVKMVEGMTSARKLIKNMQKMGRRINGIVDDAKYQAPKQNVIIFAGDIDRSKLMEIKETTEDDDIKQDQRAIEDLPLDVTIEHPSKEPSQGDQKKSVDSLIYSSPS